METTLRFRPPTTVLLEVVAERLRYPVPRTILRLTVSLRKQSPVPALPSFGDVVQETELDQVGMQRDDPIGNIGLQPLILPLIGKPYARDPLLLLDVEGEQLPHLTRPCSRIQAQQSRPARSR
ncbi:hypothetical protein G6F68_019429 [Rhizopus microsporus]|nr:hypothetical protein G6F68_019429 [Rhizopus microsporus]